MTDKTTKVNAGTLYPCNIVHKVLNSDHSTERVVLNKYWDNLTDYFNGADMPKNIVIISDMQFDTAIDYHESVQNSISKQMKQYKEYGYEIPHLIFWNVNAMYDANIPMKDEKGITFISGYSPVVFDMILKEKTGQDLMLDKLNSERYAVIW